MINNNNNKKKRTAHNIYNINTLIENLMQISVWIENLKGILMDKIFTEVTTQIRKYKQNVYRTKKRKGMFNYHVDLHFLHASSLNRRNSLLYGEKLVLEKSESPLILFYFKGKINMK